VLTASANLLSAASADSLLIALLSDILIIDGRRSGVRSQLQLQVIFCISMVEVPLSFH
jgi:hypothetical protein